MHELCNLYFKALVFPKQSCKFYSTYFLEYFKGNLYIYSEVNPLNKSAGNLLDIHSMDRMDIHSKYLWNLGYQLIYLFFGNGTRASLIEWYPKMIHTNVSIHPYMVSIDIKDVYWHLISKIYIDTQGVYRYPRCISISKMYIDIQYFYRYQRYTLISKICINVHELCIDIQSVYACIDIQVCIE